MSNQPIPDPVPSPPIKPGWQTTEWWTALAALIVPIIVFSIHPADAGGMSAALTALITGIGGVVVATAYIVSRTILKNR
jgi:hypothetical protein